MSTACAYREGNTNGPMYDSNGKKCDTLSSTSKILLIAGCSAAGVALAALGVYYLIRRARIRARRSQTEDVPARPLSAWVGKPGSTMAQSNTGGYDTDGIDYQKYAARSRASSYIKAPDGSYSPVLGFSEDGQRGGYGPVSPQMYYQPQQQQQQQYYQQQGGVASLNYQQGSYDPEVSPTKEDKRRSYYDPPRGLPVPPQTAAASRRYSQTDQDVYQYNGDARGRSPSPQREGAVSPSAYYAHRQSREYDYGSAGGEYTLEGEYGRERVEMLSPDPQYIQPGR